jgi:hypothetical protein
MRQMYWWISWERIYWLDTLVILLTLFGMIFFFGIYSKLIWAIGVCDDRRP